MNNMTAISARIALGCGLGLLCWGLPAMAQLLPGTSMPHALKGVRQAATACMRADVESPQAPGVTLVPDMTCAVSAHSVAALRQQKDAVLVDVRQASDFAAFHAEGALAASPGDLRSKPYWRNKTTILIGSGKAERELYGECTRLKRLGYKDVRVLHGGMTAWVAEGLPVAGRTPAPAVLAQLAPAEFWLETQNQDNLVVLVKELAALQKDIPFAAVVPEVNAAAIRTVVERRAAAISRHPLSAVVIATGAGFPAQRVAQLQQALSPLPLLFYGENATSFTKQVALQKAVWEAHARGPKQPACGQ